MKYIVSDIGIDYLPGEEVIGIVEADNKHQAIVTALKGISWLGQDIDHMIRTDEVAFNKYIASDYQAKEIA